MLASLSLLVWLTACEDPPLDEPEPTPAAPSPLVCGQSSDLLLAPPPTLIGGQVAAPVDVLDVLAHLTVAGDAVEVVATVRFLVGELEGLPVLQWARTPSTIALDGEPLEAGEWVTSTVGSHPQSMLLLDRDLPRCTEHVLEVTSTVLAADVETGELPRLRARGDGVWHSSALDDGVPDRYLGMWIPSNLLFDAMPLTLEVDVDDAREHELVANGAVSALGAGRWQVVFPSHFTAHAPFWALFPAAAATQSTGTANLAMGPVAVEVWKLRADDTIDLDAMRDESIAHLERFDATYGAYDHDGRFLAFMRSDLQVSMEYAGATISVPAALEHEVFHSWWARGVGPRSDRHGWLDEGVTSWVTFPGNPEYVQPLEVGEAFANLLTGEDDWTGAGLNPLLYAFGANVFGALAAEFGVAETQSALAAFYEAHPGGTYTSQTVEDWLYCAFDAVYVKDLWWNHVYQEDGFAPLPEDGVCE